MGQCSCKSKGKPRAPSAAQVPWARACCHLPGAQAGVSAPQGGRSATRRAPGSRGVLVTEGRPSQTPLWECVSVSVRQGPPRADPVPVPLADLKKYRRYEVVLTAYNVIGESPASMPVEVFVGEAGELRPDPRPRLQPAARPRALRGRAGLRGGGGGQAAPRRQAWRRPGPVVRGRVRDPGSRVASGARGSLHTRGRHVRQACSRQRRTCRVGPGCEGAAVSGGEGGCPLSPAPPPGPWQWRQHQPGSWGQPLPGSREAP